MTNKRLKLAVLPGDGIGQDVTLATIPILKALSIPVEIKFGDIGWEFWKKEGAAIPERTWRLIDESDAVLVGAITSKPEREAFKELADNLDKSNLSYVSPIIQLRQRMDLFANVRPCFSIKNDLDGFNFCVIRENTEGLYSGYDFYPMTEELQAIIDQKVRWRQTEPQDLACSFRIQSREGLDRLFRFAFKYARDKKMSRVTLADKPNVLRKSSILTREVFEEVASNYPEIVADILNVDAVALWLLRRPDEFGVIVAENMFGDILSDLGAGVMGGLGFSPSANIGKNGCYFEPVHGSAPRVKPNTANPSAMFLTISLLLEHFDYHAEAELIRDSIKNVIKGKNFLTYDLGGKSSTKEMAHAIIEQCLNPTARKKISILATGNELISGDVQDINTHHFAGYISKFGGEIYQHNIVSDNPLDIELSLSNLLSQSDAIILTGGLGPTSDDNTRYAVSAITKQPLIFSEKAWQHILDRHSRFKLNITETNKQQALFPKSATLYPNENGTAFGCYLLWKNKHIFMLPGPPKECYPMFEKFVMETLRKVGFLNQINVYRWLTLGLIEGEVTQRINIILKDYRCDIGYCWSFPYLEIKLTSHGDKQCTEIIDKIDSEIKQHIVSKDGGDAYSILNKLLRPITKKVYINGCKITREVIKEVNCSNLVFDESISGDISSNINVSLDQEVLCLEFVGRVENYDYNHQLKMPKRESDMSSHIKHYTAWQICQLITRGRLNETDSRTTKF